MKHESLPLVSTPLSELEPRELCGGVMIRLDLGYFYRFGLQTAGVKNLRYDVPMVQIHPHITGLRPWIATLQEDAIFGSGLRNSRVRLVDLIQQIDYLLAQPNDSTFTVTHYFNLTGALTAFETVLNTELSMADAYFVMEKSPFSTIALITEGEALFPPKLGAKVASAIPDMREAGKCLAFELPTAAAFHIHRATEAVLRRYWEAVTGGAAKPKLRTIGVYLAAMKKIGCGDSKVIAALTQMNELHRNPTIHPQDMLSTEEAIALLGIANSVVAAMLKEIPDSAPEEPELRLPIPETDQKLIDWSEDRAAE